MKRFLLFAALPVLCLIAAPGESQTLSDPARWEKEIAALTAQDQISPPPTGATVFVGSSSIRGWKTLTEDFPGQTIIARGFGGSEIADSTRYADRIVLPYKPKTVVLYAGDNDLAAGKTPRQVLADFQAFVKKVHAALPQTRIAFIAIKPSIARWHLADRIREANRLIEQSTKRDRRLAYIDVFTPMLGPDGKPRPELLVSDGLHMTRAGYTLWASVLRPYLSGFAPSPVRWRRIVVDPAFRSEGVTIADVNRDGKRDILVGDYWYEAPNWRKHEIRPPLTNLGDGANSYSEAFCVFADDFNGDGWTDVLVIGFPGKPCYWYENPKNRPGHWKQRLVAPSACNETPVFEDLFGDGKKRLVMAMQPQGQMYWFSVPKDIEQPWDAHPISLPSKPDAKVPGTEVFSHGLGVGDVNGDGRNDVLVTGGWWEQPRDARNSDAPWTFHPANLGEPCANLHALDVDGDGRNDVVSSSAHAKGIWWHSQKKDGTFTAHTIRDDVSQTHALNLADINGDGKPDFVTGKRWWAHGPTGDVDPMATPYLLWIEVKPQKNRAPEFVSHLIDDTSGVGTQFTVADLNGDRRPDVIVSNKRGVHAFIQERTR